MNSPCSSRGSGTTVALQPAPYTRPSPVHDDDDESTISDVSSSYNGGDDSRLIFDMEMDDDTDMEDVGHFVEQGMFKLLSFF